MLAPREIAVSEETELALGKAVDKLFRPKGLAEVLTELNIRPFTTKEIKQIKAGAARAQQKIFFREGKVGYLLIGLFCGVVLGAAISAFTFAGWALGWCYLSTSLEIAAYAGCGAFVLAASGAIYIDTRVSWGTVPLWQFRDVIPRGVINRIDAIKTAMPEAEVFVHFCAIDPIIIVCHEQQQFCVAAWDMKEVLLPKVN